MGEDFDTAVARIHRRKFATFVARQMLGAVVLVTLGVAVWMAFA